MMRSLMVVVVAMMSLACAASDPAPAQRQESEVSVPAEGIVTITGTVTDEGVECPAVRTVENQLYTITGGNRDQLRPGVRVRVTGEIAGISFCQQGTTISASKIEVLP